MRWLKSNWIWIVLAIPAAVIGYELVCYLWGEASKQGASCWFNRLKFWNRGCGGQTGPAASGSNECGRQCAASCVPASARVCGGAS